MKESIREYDLDFIALLETGQSNFAVPFLRDLAAGKEFAWFCLPPHGRSGGIFVGINTSIFCWSIEWIVEITVLSCLLHQNRWF
jgi:hypothetical protein